MDSTSLQQARTELASYPLNDVAQALRVVAKQDRSRLDRMRNHARFARLVLWAEELVEEVSPDRFTRQRLTKELRRIESIADTRRSCSRRLWLQVSLWTGILSLTTLLSYLAATS